MNAMAVLVGLFAAAVFGAMFWWFVVCDDKGCGSP
jgi:hypothetical protein